MKILTEGKAKFYAATAKIVSKDMSIFYNPVMKTNRDIAVAVVAAMQRDKLKIADPLAGSGVRSLRFLLELKSKKIASVALNDASPTATKTIKKNLKLNKLNKKTFVENTEANKFLLGNSTFDYIDIDPFGYPGPFLESAVKRISNCGIIAVTATDTAALAGTAPKACLRKYWAMPMRNELMHEIGLRILIRRMQLVAAAMEKAAIPIFSYFKDHYLRAYFKVERGGKKADEIIKQHDYFYYCNDCLEKGTIKENIKNCGSCKSRNISVAGPLWVGKLWDTDTVNKILSNCNDENTKKFVSIIAAEANINTVGFYEIHKLCKKMKLHHVPPTAAILKQLNKAAVTHFSNTGIRTTTSLSEIKKFINAATGN